MSSGDRPDPTPAIDAKPVSSTSDSDAEHFESVAHDQGDNAISAEKFRPLAFTCVALLSLAIGAVYWNTSAPGAWWGDGLEFASAARWLGVPHPPGYPLYMVLGHLAILMAPWWEAGRTLTLFSAACSLASAGLIGAIVYEGLGIAPRASSSIEPNPADRRTRWMLAMGAFITVAFTRTLWDHATFAEVYPLALVLTSSIVLLSVKMFRDRSSYPRVFLMGILWGMAALHHYSVAAVAPLAGFAILISGMRRKSVISDFALFFLVFGLMLTGFGYIPLRAAQNPPINWGDVRSFDQLLWMIRGGNYGNFFLQGEDLLLGRWGNGLRTWTDWWGRQILPAVWQGASIPVGGLVWGGSVLGCLLHSLRRRSLFGVGLIFTLFITLIFGVLYRIVDIDAYFLPALVAAAVGWAELWSQAIGRAQRLGTSSSLTIILGLTPLALGCALVLGQYREMDKSWDKGPEIWADRVLDSLPPDALLITQAQADSEIYALWYAQMVQGKRPDVTVFGGGFIFSGWYARHFESFKRRPIPLFITDRPPAGKDEFDVALIAGVIAPNLKQRRVFTTYVDPILTKYISPRPHAATLDDEYYEQTAYKLSPPGKMIYELSRNLELEPIANARFLELFGESPPLASSQGTD